MGDAPGSSPAPEPCLRGRGRHRAIASVEAPRLDCECIGDVPISRDQVWETRLARPAAEQLCIGKDRFLVPRPGPCSRRRARLGLGDATSRRMLPLTKRALATALTAPLASRSRSPRSTLVSNICQTNGGGRAAIWPDASVVDAQNLQFLRDLPSRGRTSRTGQSGLITRRSRVRIPPPLLRSRWNRGLREIGGLLFDGSSSACLE
jgi:hypothetical protein